MGDLNAKHVAWGCHTSNPSGRALLQLVDEQNITLHVPNEPTHFSPVGRPEILDLAISSGILNDLQIEVLPDLSSDHNPILLKLDGLEDYRKKQEIKTTNWTNFHYRLNNLVSIVPTLHTKEDIDIEIGTFTTDIQNTVNSCSKIIQVSQVRPYILPQHIIIKIREKRRIRKRAQRTLDPVDLGEANRLNYELKLLLREYHNDRWESKIDNLNEDTSAAWKLVRRLRNKQSHTPPIQSRNGVCYSDTDKAEAFADNLEVQCSVNNIENEATERIVSASVRRLAVAQDYEEIEPATPEELGDIIKKLHPGKAPGPDGISNKAIKSLPKKGRAKLLNIINSCLRLRYFPKRWREALVIAIPKPGKDLRRPENYRPISLLTHLSKILERIILTRLTSQLQERNIIPPEQAGFRPGHSSVHQILRLAEKVAAGFNLRDHTGILYIDVEKAFDKVWHDALLHKMLIVDLKLSTIRIVKSFLSDRTIRTKHGSAISELRDITAGVPQGSVLGPTLYLLYTYDIPRVPNTETALFADDTALIAQSRSANLTVDNLQRITDAVHTWMESWKIKINVNKSQAVFYTRSRQQPPDQIYVDNVAIQWTSHAKYLGIHLDSKLNWSIHADEVKKRGRALLKLLAPVLRSPRLHLNNKMLLYKSIIRPAITYSIGVWGCTAPTHIQKVQVIQNKALRMITNCPRYMRNDQLHRDLQVETIISFAKSTAQKLIVSSENHPNNLIRNSVNYDIEDSLRFSKRPRLLLE